ncbi:hypothetical protein [Bartonella sp. AR 15-3]|uniref:hypothetical protein n=1 Tax=Bartonella sp. AR 15-3 TaxID=545617 RepID=UPI0009C92D76|nr:hypothetical protein [Bartonella sp. AR 15-3]OPB31192.1 Coiled stalk of trimeric autotransporter adhesin [Bartonella sp. AR 15-3]
MKRSRIISKGNALNDHPFPCRSPLLKAASLGTVMTALLSSVSPVIASTFSPTEQQTTIQSSKSPKGAGMIPLKAPDEASKNSPGSAFTSDHYCGVDNILISTFSDSRKIINEENYVNLLMHHKFDNCSSHGFGAQRAIWTVDGQNTILDVSEISVLNDVLRKFPRDEAAEGVNSGKLLEKSHNISIGLQADAGNQNTAWDDRVGSIAVGIAAKAKKTEAIALGREAKAGEYGGIALGAYADAHNQEGIAIGYRAQSEGKGNVALGAYSVAKNRRVFAGYDPLSGQYLTDTLSHIWKANIGLVAIGDDSQEKTRIITGLAAGTEDTDAVNVAQLKALRELVVKNSNFVIQEGDEGDNGRITIGSKVAGTEVSFLNKNGKGRVLSGIKDGTLSKDSTEAITGGQLFKVDSDLQATKKTVSIINTNVNDLSSSLAEVQTNMNKVEGNISKIAKNSSSYLGGQADILNGKAPTYNVQGKSHNNVGSAFAGVNGSITDLYTKIANVAGSDLVEQETNNRITIGSKTGGTAVSFLNKEGSSRVLSGLKDGNLSKGSTEAVTGSQLFKVDSDLQATKNTVSQITTNVNGLSSSLTEVKTNVTKVESNLKGVTANVGKIAENSSRYFGGGTNIATGGAPTYKVQGSKHNDVGSAFAGVDAVLSNIYQELSGLEGSGGIGLVQQDTETGHITIGAKVGGTEISLVNKDGGTRVLSGLKDGNLSKGSTEAVTGGQLFKVDSDLKATKDTVTEINTTVDGLSSSLTEVKTNVSQVEGDVSKIAKHASKYLGGGANILGGEAPTYKVQGSQHNDVGSAFADVDSSITDLYTKITNVAGDSLVHQETGEEAGNRITVGSKVAGTEVNFSNKEGDGRILSGLSDGKIVTGSREAVTGSQLYETNSKVASYLGGGAEYKEGVWTDPVFKINVVQEDGSTQEQEYKNVADALKDVSTSFTNVENVFENGLVQQEESENGDGRITIGAKVGGTEISLVNKDGSRRVLSGIKDGALSEGSTEAVTGGQLFKVDSDLKATKDTVTEINTTVDGLSSSLTEVKTNVSQVEGDVSAIAKNASEYLGGGANILAGQAPTYKVQGSQHNDVGSAFAGVDSSITDLYTKITNVAGDSLVHQETGEEAGNRITVGSKVAGTEVNFSNKEGDGRVLSGLKDGKIVTGSREAVTGSQLYETNSKVASYLGGGAEYKEGVWTDPVFKINVVQEDGSTQEQEYKNVADALKDVSTSFTNIENVFENGIVQQEESENGDGRITIGAKVGGTEISLVNKDGSRRVLSGIKDGALSEGSTEAVTGGQLFKVDSDLKATKDTVTEINTTVDGLSSSLTEVKTNVSQVEGDVSAIAKNASEYLGGGANILAGQAPTYKVQGSQHNDVGSAFAGVDSSITDLYTKITNVAGDSLVHQETGEEAGNRITVGSKVAGTEVNFSNKEGDGRVLSGLKDGKIVTGSREAVTGSQLYETNSKVASYLGGGAEYKEGVWTDPVFKINVVQEDGSTQEQEYKNVADALKDVSTSFTNIENVFENGIVQQEESENGDGRITIGAKVGGTEISLVNKDGSRRVLSGIKDGALSEGSTEAVTGGQLFKVDSDLKATKDTVTEINTTVDGLSSSLTEVKTNVSQVEGDVSAIAKNASEYLGGGANILAGQAPTYKVQGSQHNDVGSAFAGVDSSITDLYTKITNVAGDSLVHQETGEEAGNRITVGSKVAGTEVNFSNKEGDGRVLSGLKDGKIVTGSREAVTGSQLYETNSKVASYLGGGAEYKEGVWTDPVFKINVVQEDGSTQEQEYKNVADALKDVSTSFTNIENVFENGIVQQEESENGDGRITIGLQTGGTEVSLLNKDGSRRVLSGLADGDLSEGSTEAVTGSQLFKVDSDLKATKDTVTEISTTVDGLSTSMTAVQGDVSKIAKNTSKYLGGGANILDRTAPTYQVQGKDYQNVGSAFAGVDDSLSDIYQELSGVGSKSLVQQEASEDGNGRITIGSQVGGTEISLANKDGEGRTLSGLKDGALSATSNEAITGKQLYEVESKVTETSGKVEDLSTSMTTVQGDVSKIAKNASEYLGGGANILDGTAPTYQVQGKDYQNVGTAFTGVDGSITDIYSKIASVAGGSLVEQEASEDGSGRITVGSKVAGAEINFSNKDDEGRVLSGIKDGIVSRGSNQAVTGNQLYTTNSQIAQYLGGGARYEDGQWIDPTFTLNVVQEDGSTQEKEYKNVADALKDVSTSFTNVENVFENGIVQQEESEDESGRITIGAKVGGTEISLANKDGEGRILSGLKDGALSATSNEAVTGKQLYEVDSKFTASVDELSTSMTAVQGDVSKIAENASQYLGAEQMFLKEQRQFIRFRVKITGM